MDTTDLETYIKADERISKFYGGVLAKDMLPRIPKKPGFYIVNTDTSEKPGSHWIVVFVIDNEISEYFDPLGKSPDGYFISYLTQQSGSYRYNVKRCQNYVSNICGQYCLFFCYFRARAYSMEDILKMFQENDLVYNDQLVYFFYNYTK